MVKDAEFVEYIVKNLVDNPDKVHIDRKVDEMGVLITVDVDREDMGKIIGRAGATAKAIRTILRVVGMKNNARVNLKINEPDGDMEDMIGSQSGQEGPAHNSKLDDVDAVMDEIKNI